MKTKLLFALVVALVCAPAFAQSQGSGQILAAGSSCGTSNCVRLNVAQNYGSVVITAEGTFSATLQFEGTAGITYLALQATPIAGGAVTSSTTATGAWRVDVSGLTSVQVRGSSYASGIAQINITPSTARASTATQVNGASIAPFSDSGLFFSQAVTGSDRAAAARSIWSNGLGGSNPLKALDIHMEGEVNNASATGGVPFQSQFAPCTDNKYGCKNPVDANVGPTFFLPPLAMIIDKTEKMASDQMWWIGSGPGGINAGAAQGNMFTPSNNFNGNIGSGTTCSGGAECDSVFSPGLIGIGVPPGLIASAPAATGPYNIMLQGTTADADNYTSGSAVLSLGIPFVNCSGQDNDVFDTISLNNGSAVGAEIGCDSNFVAGNGAYRHFFIKHSDTNSCINSSLSNTITWNYVGLGGTLGRVDVTYADSPTVAPRWGMAIQPTMNNGGTHATVATRSDWGEICASPGPGNVTQAIDPNCNGASYSSAKQFSYLINSAQQAADSGTGTSIKFGTTGFRFNAVGGGKTIGPISDSSQGCVNGTATGGTPLLATISGRGIFSQDFHSEGGDTGMCIGCDQQAQNITFTDLQPSSQLNNSVIITNYWGPALNVNIFGLGGTNKDITGNPATTNSLIDRQNGNIYTSTLNQGIGAYLIGADGRPWTNANPNLNVGTPANSSQQNGWNTYQGLNHVTAGVQDFGVNTSSTSLDTICQGCTNIKRQTSNGSQATAGTFSTIGGTFVVSAPGNYRVSCNIAYQIQTAASGIQLEFTNSGTTTNAMLWTSIYSNTNTAPLNQLLTTSGTPVSGANVNATSTTYMATIKGIIEVGGSGGASLAFKYSPVTTNDNAIMLKDSDCAVDQTEN